MSSINAKYIKTNILASIDLKYIDTFLDSADEHLATLDECLLKLETSPDNSELIDTVFRAVHSLKGDSAAIGLLPIKDIAHEMESILDMAREKKLKITPHLLDAQFNAINVIRYIISCVAKKQEPNTDIRWVVEKLEKIKTNHSGDGSEDHGFELERRKEQIEEDDLTDNVSDSTYVMFKLEDFQCALSLSTCEEVVENLYITRVPFLENYIEGAVNLRGEIVPVINLKKRFHFGKVDYPTTKILIVRRDNEKIGLMVDMVFAINEIKDEFIFNPGNEIYELEKTFVKGVFKFGGKMIMQLNAEKLTERIAS